MALYTILFGLSIFMIALVLAIIKKMFFQWKEEHKIERTVHVAVDRPAVNMILYSEKCIVRRREYPTSIQVYDVISKSDLDLQNKTNDKGIDSPEVMTEERETETFDMLERNLQSKLHQD